MSDDISNDPQPVNPADTPEGPEVGAAPPEPETTASDASEPAAPRQTPGEAWDDVVVRLGELGDALSAWAKAATDSPENRKHLDEVRTGVNDMARQASDAFAEMTGGEFGRSVSEGASNMGQAIGDSATEFGQAAAPHIASAFAGIADAFGRAAQKVGEASAPSSAPPTRPAPEPPATPMPAAPEPPADDEEDSAVHE